jgi:uncharacterized repeat protein (TIGR03847 family)
MSEQHRFERVDAFTAATEGRPGQRVFYLQVRSGPTVITVKCEKGQVDALGQYLGRLLGGLPEPAAPADPSGLQPATPLLSEFVVGAISVAYDNETDRFVVEVEEVVAVDETGEPDPEALEDHSALQFQLERAQAAAFASRAAELVAAGRPPCRFCGGPLDPEGHACPRMN